MLVNIRSPRLFVAGILVRRVRLLMCLVTLLAGASAAATSADSGPAFLVRDINPTFGQHQLNIESDLVVLGSRVYFVAEGANGAYGLWSSNGTAQSISLVKELPGAAMDIANVGGILFITLVDDEYLDSNVSQDLKAIRALWKSDGTTAGTILLKSFAQGAFQFVNVNNRVFFAADDGVSGLELWRSDGTVAGTALVKDINPGPAGSKVRSLANGNGTLFFMADGPRTDSQGLWKSDGSVAGTVLFKESSAFVNPALDSLTNVNGTLFFVAEGALWTTDGTNFGTYSLNDNRRFIVLPGSLTNLNGTLFFFARYNQKAAELWKSDGSVDGTVAVTGVNLPADISITSVTTSSGRLYFTVYDSKANGRALWRSDGTAAGTVMLKDISRDPYISYIGSLTNLGNLLFFLTGEYLLGQELWRSSLWRSDGTAAGTILLQALPIDATARSFVQLGGVTLFLRVASQHMPELWTTDGTPAGTRHIPLTTVGGVTSNISNLTAVGEKVAFVADDGAHGSELWASDGSAAGTVLIRDLEPGAPSSYVSEMISIGSTLFFNNWTEQGHGLWRSDGTISGTRLITATSASHLTNVDGTLFFVSNGGLWKSDGTAAGTVPVVATGEVYTDIAEMESVEDTLFFTVTMPASSEWPGTSVRELWKSAGTSAGTTLLHVFELGPLLACYYYSCSYKPSVDQLTEVNGRLFFRAYDTIAGYELWTSDGTPAGTVRVRDINPGRNDGDPADLVDLDGTLFFRADDGISGRELWRSDSTPAGTTRAVDIIPGPEGAIPSSLVSVDSTLFFAASDATGGSELWRSDGTATGTRRVQEIVPGPAGGNPRDLAAAGGYLFFSADDGQHGRELWALGLDVDAYIQAPARVGVLPGGAVAIPVQHGDHGLIAAGARIITATLDPALTYLDDTTGITPTISGQAVTWRLPAGPSDFRLRVRAPNAPFGATYPVTLTLAVGAETHPVDNTKRMEVMIARQLYLPVMRP